MLPVKLTKIREQGRRQLKNLVMRLQHTQMVKEAKVAVHRGHVVLIDVVHVTCTALFGTNHGCH
jgi:hypothetical protein